MVRTFSMSPAHYVHTAWEGRKCLKSTSTAPPQHPSQTDRSFLGDISVRLMVGEKKTNTEGRTDSHPIALWVASLGPCAFVVSCAC